MNTSVGQCMTESLLVRGAVETWTADDVGWVRDQAEILAVQGFDGNAEAREEMHRTAYTLFLAHYVRPWGSGLVDVSNPIFTTFLWVFGREWDRADRRRHADLLEQVPEDPEAYPDWITELVQAHRSNVGHPLFEFLAAEASTEQLREFFLQETPFDLHFADILASLLPGIYGEPKMEIADNFWDEMGCGDAKRTHRNLRLELMEHLDLPTEIHAIANETFVIEEIELANAFFLGTIGRTRAVQLVGMLMATESMVPGRLQKQIDGWRRVGLEDRHMEYLLEHTVVDVEHAEHWMQHVVQPIARERPEAMVDLTLGALRRLDAASGVCDRMMEHLDAAGVSAAG